MIVEWCGRQRVERPGPDLNERLATWQKTKHNSADDDAREPEGGLQ